MSDKEKKKTRIRTPLSYLLIEDGKLTGEFSDRRTFYAYAREHPINAETTKIFRATEKILTVEERTIRKPKLV